MARRLGATAAQLAAAERENADDGAALAPDVAAALRYAEALTRSGGPVPDDVFATLSAHWSAPQIVEITAVAGLFNYFNRFAGALNVPVTR